MKKSAIILLLVMNLLVFAQENCQYSVTINSDRLKETGVFQLTIKNVGDKSFKIRREINFCNMLLNDLEYYNEKTNQYEKMYRAKKDIDCFTYRDKSKTLKPQKSYNYDVNIKSDFEVIQSENFFDTFNDIKYRFKISFYLDSYDVCGDSNDLFTDWIYKN